MVDEGSAIAVASLDVSEPSGFSFFDDMSACRGERVAVAPHVPVPVPVPGPGPGPGPGPWSRSRPLVPVPAPGPGPSPGPCPVLPKVVYSAALNSLR